MVMFGIIIAAYKKGLKDLPDGKFKNTREIGTQNCLPGFVPLVCKLFTIGIGTDIIETN